MSKKVLSLLLFVLVISICVHLRAVVKGSETAVSVQPLFTFPASDSNNKILGFAWFKNGFFLEDNTTTCTFDAIYPVSGDVDLNGGTLYLSQDLIFQNVANLTGLGTFFGDNHMLNLCSSINELPSEKGVFENIEISLDADLIVTDTLLFKGNCKIFGHNYDLIFDNGYIIIDSGAQVRFSHVTLEGVKEDNFIMTDDSSSLIFENAIWKQIGHYTFSNGAIEFLNYNDFVGSYSFVYESNLTSTICENSTWSLSDGMCLRIGRKNSADDTNPLYFEDQTAVLRFNGATILVTDYGMQFLHGQIEFDSNSQLETVGTTTSTGVIFGSGVESDDFLIGFNSGAALKFESGMFVYNNYKEDCITAFSDIARLIRYNDSSVYLIRDCLFPNMVLKIVSGDPQTMLASGVTCSYDRNKIVFSSVEYDFLGHQSGDYSFYLGGNEYLYLTKGTFSKDLNISGLDNSIYGAGNVSGSIILQDSNTGVSLNLNGLILGDIYLNNGTLTLAGDTSLGSDAVFAAGGTVNLAAFNLELSGLDSNWTSTIHWQNTSGAINLNSKINLSGQWIFDNSCIINGNGHTINVGAAGQILVTDGAQLTLRNVVLHMVSDDDIQCLTNNSAIILDNSTWMQDTHITFSSGSLKFINNVDFVGSYSFIYDTSRTATIAANSTWKITGGMKLYLGKESEDSSNPVYMENCNSKLWLDDCSFCVTGQGMNLTRGNIDIDKNVTLEIVGTDTSTGLMLGSGIQEDNIITYLSSGCSFNFRSGQLVYNNTVNNGFVALSESGHVIRYADSKFHIMSDLIFPSMYLQLYSGAPVTTKSEGATYSYDQSHISLTGAEFDFKGQQYSSTVLLLAGDNYIYMNKGNLALGILVEATSNEIYGTGNISGPIILQDTSAELLLNLNGLLLNDITLNGGCVKLEGDLVLGGDYNFIGTGTVKLQKNGINFGDQDSIWTSTIYWTCGCGCSGSHPECFGCPRSIKLNAYTKLTGKWQFDDDCIINGNGNTLEIDQVGQLVVGDNVKLILRDLTLKLVASNSISLLNDESKLELDNVSWVQFDDITFSHGSISFFNQVDFIGSFSFIYDSSKTSTIGSNSTWKITLGMNLCIGRKEAQNYVEPLYMEDNTSILKLDNCSFIVTATGMELTNGKLFVSRDVDFSITGTTVSNGLTLGNSVQANDVTLTLNAGACLSFSHGCVSYNNFNNDKVKALSENSMMKIFGETRYHMSTDLILSPMIFKIVSEDFDLTLGSGVNFSFDKSRMVFENAEFDFAARYLGSDVYALEGNNYIYMTKGVYLFPTQVSGTGNQVFGNGSITGSIVLEDSNAELICDLNGVFCNTINLNGGNVTLMGDLFLGGDYTIEGPGQVRLMRYNLMLGVQDSVWTSTLGWHSNGVYKCPYNYPRGIDFNSNVALSGKWEIQDNCTITGNGHMFDLGQTGQIEVQEGVHLTLRNIILYTAGNNNIYCLADNSSITFDSVEWIQDSNVTFTKGRMRFVNDVDFVGSYSFVYDSSQTSTIADDSYWRFSGGIVLRIGKKEEPDSLEPLYFENGNSVFKLDNCNLVITGSGMTLTRGELNVDSDVIIDIVGTTTLNGFTLGDGTQEGDAIFKLNAGANLHFRSGKFCYNACTTAGIVALSENATIIRYGGSSAYVNKDWTIPFVTIKAALGFPETLIRDGVSLRYDNTNLTFSESYFEYTGSQSPLGYFVMTGNDYIFIDKGSFVFPVAVAGTGNMIYGAGGFNGLLMLQDANTELIFAFNGTLGEDVMMNGAKIILGDDLYLTGGTMLVGSGRIDLAGFKLAFGGQDLIWSSPYYWEGESSSCIDIRSKFDLRSTWTLSGTFTLNGYGNILDLSNGGNIVIEEDSHLVLRNVKITGVSGSNIQCLDDNSIVTLDNVIWVQDGNYTFTKGRFKILNDVDLIGSYSFIYDTSQTSTIELGSSLRISGDMAFRIGKNDIASLEPLYFVDSTSTLKLDNCNLVITGSGMKITKGSIDVDRDVVIDIVGTTTSNGFILGSGIENEDAIFRLSFGATLHFASGKFVYNDYTDSGIVSSSENATIIRYGGSSAYINRDWTVPSLVIKAAQGFPETIIREGVKIRYENTHLTFTESCFEYTGSQSIYGYFVMEGNDYIFIDKGAFVFPVAVMGSGNMIYGAGGFNGLLMLQDSNTELTFAFNGTLGEDVMMNGAKIILGDDLYLTGGTKLIGSGKIDLAGFKLAFGGQDLIWSSPYYWEGESSSCIDIRSKFDLRSTWTLSGTFTLNGYGNILDLSNGGNIVIEDDSSLILRNVKVAGVSGNNIRCLGDNSVIILDDATWVQDGNYTFTMGALQIKNEVKMEGPYIFSYQTKMTSTVLQDSLWRFGTDSTLDYAPSMTASKDLIALYDSTAGLKFCCSSLHATATGINLKKGYVTIKGECIFYSDTQEIDDETEINEGIIFGSGLQDDDCMLQISLGSVLSFTKGAFVYNNISPTSLTMENKVSSIKVLYDTEFRLLQDLNVEGGVLYISDEAFLNVAPGKKVIGSMFVVE